MRNRKIVVEYVSLRPRHVDEFTLEAIIRN
jgi:hypothetical protein